MEAVAEEVTFLIAYVCSIGRSEVGIVVMKANRESCLFSLWSEKVILTHLDTVH